LAPFRCFSSFFWAVQVDWWINGRTIPIPSGWGRGSLSPIRRRRHCPTPIQTPAPTLNYNSISTALGSGRDDAQKMMTAVDEVDDF